ncbi:transcription termination/antitermination protein NusG [Candidatus Phytoplasma palmae]|uniref:transcription termination/antitermination protein NusG n=1 Tax=Candidatus Phytoplasma palmae TaxID=85624 RepID=UPI00399096AB
MKNKKKIINEFEENKKITNSENNQKPKWYIIQTYSGYENSVKEDLLKLANSGVGVSNLIFQVICPKEKYFKFKADGSKQEKEKKMFSGYIFIKMIVTEQSWFVVRNIPKVTGFLGSIKGSDAKPVPLSEKEINPILIKMGIIKKPNYDHLINKRVEITHGSFAGQKGKVAFVEHSKDKIIVEIDLFGRNTPIEISFACFKEIN